MKKPETLYALLGIRWEIANCLLQRPYLVSKLQRKLDIEQSRLSHHLQVMRHAGIIRKQIDGKYQLVNSLAFAELKEATMQLNRGVPY